MIRQISICFEHMGSYLRLLHNNMLLSQLVKDVCARRIYLTIVLYFEISTRMVST